MGPDRFVNNDKDTEWSEELRLQSSYAGPMNFNLGAIYIHLYRDDLLSVSDPAYDAISTVLGIPLDTSTYPNGTGHNYYYGLTPYKLDSYAAFGEVYWQVAPDWRVTAGLRYTDDQKTEYNYAVEILQPGPPGNPFVGSQSVSFKEPTGRFVLDWTPKLAFTDRSMFYASYSRVLQGRRIQSIQVGRRGGAPDLCARIRQRHRSRDQERASQSPPVAQPDRLLL